MPVTVVNSEAARCVVEPAPAVPKFTPFSFSRSFASMPAMSRTPDFLLADRTTGTVATSPIGIRSLRGSNGMFG